MQVCALIDKSINSASIAAMNSVVKSRATMVIQSVDRLLHFMLEDFALVELIKEIFLDSSCYACLFNLLPDLR